VVEIRVMMRFCLAMVFVGCPLVIGMPVFLVLQSFQTSAKIDHLVSPIVKLQGDYDRLSERVLKLEQAGHP
jgi:hypothetical protein